jgi:hypothetical protein
MGKGLNLRKLWEKGYKISVLASTINYTVIPVCLLCEDRNVTLTAFFIDEQNKRVIEYFLCESCGCEILILPEAERTSILEKVVEQKINMFQKEPHLKMSELNLDVLSAMNHKPIKEKDLKKMLKKNENTKNEQQENMAPNKSDETDES